MDPELIAVFIPIIAVAGGIAVALSSIKAKSRLRELQIQERIAMIEKGLVPSPETDPQGFDRVMSRYEPRAWTDMRVPSRRHRSAGIILIGVGLGLMLLMGLAGGVPMRGVGVGGFLVLLGIAFFVNAHFDRRDRMNQPSTPPPPTLPN